MKWSFSVPLTSSMNFLITISFEEIAARLHACRKPRSRVPGDVFPQLINNYAPAFATPLEIIYNAAFSQNHWPAVWKNKYVTIIPKSSSPENLGGCRNISCTNLFSKVLESFLLDLAWGMVGPYMKINQYGGQIGTGTEQFLAHLWTGTLEDLEDSRGPLLLFHSTLPKSSTASTILTFWRLMLGLEPQRK